MRGRSTRFLALRLLALTVLAFDACSNTESCRTDTLFMTVELGPYTTADQLDVDVVVEAAGDAAASTPKHGQLALKPGARSGGVEVQFPDGYQAGRTATITLTLLSGGSSLATRVKTSVLSPGCSTLTVDFGASDAGNDGGGGAAGGEQGGGGAVAGQGGTATGGGGGAAKGGSGGGATGGSGGAAGSRGTGGSGGAAGNRGTGGGAGGAGGAVCKKTGAENCFDGIDNDCNGLIDCADPACGSAIAQCVALDPTSAPIGLLSGVGAGACGTSGYDQPTAIFANPNQLSCTTVIAGKGCSCA
ncbi:MAG TPA: hypothetical protein VLA79_02970, partial [Polyangia bacterium]|nr:hypothetical protein [Polyangia bacterium]